MDELVESIKNTNIDNVIELYDILAAYDNLIIKQKFDFCNNSINYIRHKIYCDDNKEIILIQWPKDSVTKIHDHPENGCIFKVLCGRLKEYIYNTDNVSSKIIKKNDISYIDSHIGLHKIIALENSFTLHVYSPPGYYTSS